MSVIVRVRLQFLKPVSNTTREVDSPHTELDQPISKATLRQLVEEQIRPLREQVRRLEAELQALAGGRE